MKNDLHAVARRSSDTCIQVFVDSDAPAPFLGLIYLGMLYPEHLRAEKLKEVNSKLLTGAENANAATKSKSEFLTVTLSIDKLDDAISEQEKTLA